MVEVLDVAERGVRIPELTEEVRQINREREGLMDRLRNLDAYRELRFTLFDLQDRVGFVGPEESLPELEALQEHPLLAGPESALSLRARERYHYVSNLLRFLRRDFPGVAETFDMEWS